MNRLSKSTKFLLKSSSQFCRARFASILRSHGFSPGSWKLYSNFLPLFSSRVYISPSQASSDASQVKSPPPRPSPSDQLFPLIVHPFNSFIRLYLLIYLLLSILVFPMVSFSRLLSSDSQSYSPRPIPADLGVPKLEGASNFINRFFPREFVISHQYKPSDHVIQRHDIEKGSDIYSLNDVFVHQSYAAFLRTSRTATLLITDQVPFSEVGHHYSFDNSVACSRALDIGGFPVSHLPDLDNEKLNPLSKSFDSELDLLRTAHRIQKSIKLFLKFIERAYNKKGHSVDNRDPWDFNAVLAPAQDDSLNVSFLFSSSAQPLCARQILSEALDRIQSGHEVHTTIPIDESERPASPIRTPAPTPVTIIPGLDVIHDLDKIASQLADAAVGSHSSESRLVSLINTPKSDIDPSLLNHSPTPAVSASSQFVQVEINSTSNICEYHNDGIAFHPGCHCRYYHVFKEAYKLGRKDENQSILRQNIEDGFVAHRIQDFFDFVSCTADELKFKTFPATDLAEDSSLSPPLGSPIRSISPI
jgi:hypothetical protein